jgi:plastocyanin
VSPAMRKILVTLLAVVALVGAACGNDNKSKKAAAPTGPQTYVVDVDAAAPPQFQISNYFPSALTVHPGDTIEFQNKSAGYPHTVTFGIKPDQSNRPAPVNAKGEENPLNFGSCFTDSDPTPALTACPTPSNPAAPPTYAGKGFWHSGVMFSNQAAFPKSITLKLSDSIADGTYTYLCVLHAFMGGVITVAKNGDRLTPTAVRAKAEVASAKAIADANALKPPAATPGNVTAGFGDRITAVNVYDPGTITIKAGETVTWKNAATYEPHTVTFKSPYNTPGEPGVNVPHGDKSGGTYSGGFTNSGFFGAAPFFPISTFSLKFAKAGTYDYVCAIHPGMKGTVTVT